MTSMRLAAQDEKARAENGRRRKPNRTRALAKQERGDKPLVVSKREALAVRPYIFGEDSDRA